MKIIFEEMKFKNILSYGNKLETFVFEKGLNAITGRNGHGKSSILDILSFSLFGVPYRKIKINELINRINQKNLFVEISFKADRDSFIIQRGIKPNILKIFKNDKEIDILSSKVLVQQEIDNILGLDNNLFKQIIALSVNTNKPFLSQTLNEKRAVIESIFNINVFGEMMKIVKSTLSDLKIEQQIKGNELRIVEENYKSRNIQLEKFKENQNNFDLDKKTEIEEIEKQIQDYKKKIEKCENNLRIGKDSLEKYIFNDITKEKENLSTLKSRLSVINFEKTILKESKDFLENNDVCKTCGNNLTESHKTKHIKENLKNIEKLNKEESNVIEQINSLENLIKKNNENKSMTQKIEVTIDKEEDKKNFYLKEIENKNSQKLLVESREMNFDIGEFEKGLEKLKEELKNLKEYNDKINHKINTQTILSKILSETGVKSHFLKRLLPLLNMSINKYLEEFEMPFLLNFNENFEESIISIVGKTGEISYFSCSEGEKKRFDISILLSFIDFIKLSSNWDCNVLFFDELLDSAVDPLNLKLIMDSIKIITRKNSQCTYVVSHRINEDSNFDSIIRIEKQNSFSCIKK